MAKVGDYVKLNRFYRKKPFFAANKSSECETSSDPVVIPDSDDDDFKDPKDSVKKKVNKQLYTVKGVIFVGFYFRYIHNLFIDREFNTPQITAKLYCTYCES